MYHISIYKYTITYTVSFNHVSYNHVSFNHLSFSHVSYNGCISLQWFVDCFDALGIPSDFEFSSCQGSAKVDFTGTGHEVYGNVNAPRAVTLSALIYCLRCMVGHDVPLNQASLS